MKHGNFSMPRGWTTLAASISKITVKDDLASNVDGLILDQLMQAIKAVL